MQNSPNPDDYDVVLDVLQQHHDKLWNMTKANNEWGIMDYIRLEQMHKLKEAMNLWKQHR